jgi:hypothetical protein
VVDASFPSVMFTGSITSLACKKKAKKQKLHGNIFNQFHTKKWMNFRNLQKIAE